VIPAPDQITVVLLAGGAATRLPGKLAMPIEGEPMVARVHRRLTSTGLACIASFRDANDPTRSLLPSVDAAFDEAPGQGPLGGLISACAKATTPLIFAAAGDVPGLGVDFIGSLKDEYDRSRATGGDIEAVVPRWPDGTCEPLAALYDRAALERAGRETLASSERRVMAAVQRLQIAYHALADADRARLFNVNTSADYVAASERSRVR
jgi:molybdenum cofactor guanylyltransferase